MNTFLKLTLKFSLAVVILFSAAALLSDSVDISNLKIEQLSADKPLFGADEFPYEPGNASSPEKTLSSRINWAIIIFSVLMVLVLSNAFDISKYTSKITGRETVDHNKVNKWIMLLFMVIGLLAVVWEFQNHGKFILLNNSSSEHGIAYDQMFTITLVLTTIVFFITQFLLFFFSFKYAHNSNRKALYYAHNNRLEVIWTLIPALVLTTLVLKGHQTWRSVVYAEENHSGKIKNIEVFAYQFGWKARYSGDDGIMGNHDYKFIGGSNDLGLAYLPEVQTLLESLKADYGVDTTAINDLKKGTLTKLKADLEVADGLKDYKAMASIQEQIDDINSGEALKELKASVKRKLIQISRIEQMIKENTVFNTAAMDDIITQEIHIAKDSLITFNFRSKDIIHSAWLPHFRAQMNVVPGMPTKFTFKPTKSTAEAKAENGEEFEYYLYCNKICGVSHYNMKIKVVVESQKEVDEWLKTQQPAFMVRPAVEITPDVQSDTTQNQMMADTMKKLAIR
jgi:cytochrome c oxidase subunit II